MCRQVWEEHFFRSLLSEVIDKCCNIINLQRYGQPVDISLLKIFTEILSKHSHLDRKFVIIIRMLISDSHDFNKTMSKFIDHHAASVNLYQEYFEVRFLKDVDDFYRNYTASPDQTDSLLTYLEQVRVTFANKTIVLTSVFIGETLCRTRGHTHTILSSRIDQIVIIRNSRRNAFLSLPTCHRERNQTATSR